jgi:hypothetical protein
MQRLDPFGAMLNRLRRPLGRSVIRCFALLGLTEQTLSETEQSKATAQRAWSAPKPSVEW